MKKLVAYSSVSHLGFVVLGLAAMNTEGVQGAVYQMLNHGVSTGGLFLIVTLSSIGLPGLNGFVGEFLILLGAFRADPRMAAFAATGVILSATYMLWMFQRVNYGPVTNEKNARLADLTPRELAVIVPVIALTIVMGVFPNVFLRPIEPSVERTLNQIHQRASAVLNAKQAVPAPAAAPATVPVSRRQP
jgi:NADH-quinone oxidoreductase subunit M